MPAIVVVGEALVDLFGEPGAGLADAKTFVPRNGGAPANLAVSAAKLGGDVGFIGRVGADGFGDALCAAMTSFGVNTDRMIRDTDKPTMLACVALPRSDAPEFILWPGANVNLVSSDITPLDFRGTKLMAFGSVTLAYDSASAILNAANIALTEGAEVVFDVNYRPNIWSSVDEAITQTFRAIAKSTVIKMNADEVKLLFGQLDISAAAEKLIDAGARMVCISLGSDGAYFRTESAEAFAPGYEVTVADATGAGDAFLAGVSVWLCECGKDIAALSGGDLERIGAFANASGAIAATRLGGMDAVFNREDVAQLQAGYFEND